MYVWVHTVRRGTRPHVTLFTTHSTMDRSVRDALQVQSVVGIVVLLANHLNLLSAVCSPTHISRSVHAVEEVPREAMRDICCLEI